MTKYNVSPLVAREIEFSTGTIFGGSWCRYFISITLHQCYIEATWKTRPKNDLDGHKEIFNSLQEYLIGLLILRKLTGGEYPVNKWYMLHTMKQLVPLVTNPTRIGLPDVLRRSPRNQYWPMNYTNPPIS